MSLDHASKLVKQQSLTRDAFLGGRLIVSQPERGFRAGLDSVLLGAAVSGKSRSLLDLGAGVGTASLVAMADIAGLTGTLVDSDPEMAGLAAANLGANGMAERGRVLALDVTAPGKARAEAGLPENQFTSVIANPPFFESGRGTAPSGGRAAARHMAAGELDRWVRTASTHAAADGEAIFILPAESLAPILAAFDQRFGAIAILPIAPHENEAATRILVRGTKGSRAPLRLLASRALHSHQNHGFRPDFDAIFRGEARLVW